MKIYHTVSRNSV